MSSRWGGLSYVFCKLPEPPPGRRATPLPGQGGARVLHSDRCSDKPREWPRLLHTAPCVHKFLNSARLDNLATCFVALEAITNKSKNVADDDMISMIALFDHEEIGSQSTHGAGSPVMAEAVKRVTLALSDNSNAEVHASAVRKSFVMSVDQAHAVHPNYASKHEKNHGPKMNAGVVLKTNQNQRCKSSLIFTHISCTIQLEFLLLTQCFILTQHRCYQRCNWIHSKRSRTKRKDTSPRIRCEIRLSMWINYWAYHQFKHRH